MHATMIVGLALLGVWASAVSANVSVTCHLVGPDQKFISSASFTVDSESKVKCTVDPEGGSKKIRYRCRKACKSLGAACTGFILADPATCVGQCCGDGTKCVQDCESRTGCKLTCPRGTEAFSTLFAGWRALSDDNTTGGNDGTTDENNTNDDESDVGSDSNASGVGAVVGDPHFQAIGNQQNFEFQGVSGLPFAILTEPRSQLNALFHNLGREGTETFVKSIGFIHISGVTAAIDSGYETCDVDGAEGAQPLTITLKDEAVNLDEVTKGAKQGKWSLYNNATTGVSINYERTETGDQKVAIQTNELRYITNMGRVACHLDTQVQVLDAQLLSAGFMDGILGQSASWQSEDGTDAVEGDETDYMVPELLDPKFGRSLFGVEVDTIVARKARKLLSRDAPVTFATKMGSLSITLPATLGATSMH